MSGSGSETGGWVAVALDCPGACASAVEEALTEAGAIATTLEDAGEEPRFESWPPERPLWGSVRVTGLFPAGVDGLGRLARSVAPETLASAREYDVPDTDWARAGRERVGPMRFGERLWVCPTWVQAPPDAATGVVVRLDPGLAFGTGSHPSTALCLRHLARRDLAGLVVVDYGCGSGVLGIAALRLGARRCLAVDIDPQALGAARENAIRNRVAEHFDIMSPEAIGATLRRPDTPTCDLLVANLLAGPLATLAVTFAGLVGDGGELVLSGILSEQAAGLIETYAPWFGLTTVTREDDWVLLAGSRTG